MNNKTIVILSVIIVLIMASFGFYYLTKNSYDSDIHLKNVVLLPLIKGCALTDKGEATKGIGGTEQAPKIEIIDNQIVYSRAINHQCCRKVEIEKKLSGSIINIFEVWSGEGCKCMCFSEIQATLNNIPSGPYKINVYEKGTNMEQKLIISKEISI